MKLGSKVKSEFIVLRRGAPKYNHTGVYHTGWKNTWHEHKVPPVRGVYMGFRYYQNGYTVYGFGEDQTEWHQESTVKVALIVTHEHRNPVAVPFNRLEIDE